jgi:hypothetical protein
LICDIGIDRIRTELIGKMMMMMKMVDDDDDDDDDWIGLN